MEHLQLQFLFRSNCCQHETCDACLACCSEALYQIWWSSAIRGRYNQRRRFLALLLNQCTWDIYNCSVLQTLQHTLRDIYWHLPSLCFGFRFRMFPRVVWGDSRRGGLDPVVTACSSSLNCFSIFNHTPYYRKPHESFVHVPCLSYTVHPVHLSTINF